MAGEPTLQDLDLARELAAEIPLGYQPRDRGALVTFAASQTEGWDRLSAAEVAVHPLVLEWRAALQCGMRHVKLERAYDR